MTQSPRPIAVMFADITGSTRLYSEVGNAQARAMVSECLDGWRTVVSRHEGRVIQVRGDGMLCIFPSADASFEAATALREHQRNRPLAIHAGLHFGDVFVDGDYIYGDAVNVAARMSDIAKSGEIVATEQIVEHFSPPLRQRTRLVEKVPVKGKREPVGIYLLVSEMDDVTGYRSVAAPIEIDATTLEIECTDQHFTLDEQNREVVLGRIDECHLIVNHELVSRRHATIECKRGKFFLVDHSTNGTYVRSQAHELTLLRRELVQLVGKGVISLGVEPEQEPDHLIRFRQMPENE